MCGEVEVLVLPHHLPHLRVQLGGAQHAQVLKPRIAGRLLAWKA